MEMDIKDKKLFLLDMDGTIYLMTGCLTVSVISWKRCGKMGEDIFS